MAKTQLNLKLSYKGKLLDIVKQGREFVGKWFIGSDKHLLWQILDPSFPNRHQLVTKRGNDLYLQLVPGASLSCSKDGNPVDAAYLQQNGILNGTNLLLRNDMSGNINLGPNWDIRYEYAEPQVNILTEKERQLVAQFARREQLSSTERMNRGLILIALILGIAFMLFYDFVLKPRANEAATLAAKLAELERAQRIEAQVAEQELLTQEEPVPETKASGTAQTAQKGTASKPGAATTAQSTFGKFRSTDTTSGAYSSYRPSVQSTVLRDFVTARPGSKGGTGGGPGGVGPGFDISGGAGGGYASSFNPDATAAYNQTELGRVLTGNTPAGGTTVRPEGRIENFTGDASKLAPARKPIAQSAQTQRIIQSFRSADVTTLSENNVVGSVAGQSADIDDVTGQLQGRKGQLTQLYRKHSAIQASSGSIYIKMYIGTDGRVAADVTPNSATFTQAFLQEVKQLVENWTFRVSKKTIYGFTTRLTQR